MSALKAMFNKIGTGYGTNLARLGMDAVVTGGEALATGGTLGVLHATVGLDVKGKVPVDFGIGVIALGASAARGGDPHALAIGTSALSAFAFRQAFGFASEKKLAKGETPKGTFKPLLSAKMLKVAGDFDAGEDPIIALARTL